jgi:hypothetical protein
LSDLKSTLFCAKKKIPNDYSSTFKVLTKGFHFFWVIAFFWLFLKKILKKPWENEYFPSVKKNKIIKRFIIFLKNFFSKKEKLKEKSKAFTKYIYSSIVPTPHFEKSPHP